jgi:hypothetical protein
MGAKWQLIVVLICVCLVVSEVEHLLICLLAIYVSSLEKYLSLDFAYVQIGLFDFFLLNYRSSWYILDINPLLGM